MSTPSRVETKAVASEAADSELVRLFAVLAKASFTYQENNRRTQEAHAAFASALAARVEQTKAPFVLENRSDGLYTATGKEPVEPLREWLRITMQKGLIGAIRIEGGVRVQVLHPFLAQLRVAGLGKIRKGATFQALWPESFDGIELRELRFFGGYHAHDPRAEGASGPPSANLDDTSSDLRGALLRLDLSDAQLERILALEQRLATLQTGTEDGELLSLPREVLAALPADVVDDAAVRPVFVDRLLDRFEKLVDAPGSGQGRAPQSLGNFVEMFRQLPQAFFAPDSDVNAADEPAPLPSPPPSLPHRPEDHADELEDPAKLLPLVAALPLEAIDLEPSEVAMQAETLRVCLYQLGADVTPRVAAPAAAKVRKILERPSPDALAVIGFYVTQALQRTSDLPSPAVVDRVLLRLDQHQLSPELRRKGGLTIERVIRHFPNAFVPFLKSLSDGSAPDAEALALVLKSLKETPLAAGTKRLLQQGEILNPELLRKLFRLGGRSAFPIASCMLSARVSVLQEEIVAWLRGLGSVQAEAAPLVFLEPSSLPVQFLQELCEFERTGRPNLRLRSQAGGLLYSFVESTPNDAHLIARKALAITGLAAFPGPPSEALLKAQLRGSGLLGPMFVPQAIRDAVRQVRARWKGGKDV